MAEAEPVDLSALLRESHEVLNEAIADRIVGILNEALKLDRDAVLALVFGEHVPCNQALADHDTIQVAELSTGKFGIRPMGLLNGLAGILPSGMGRVAGVFSVDCPKHGRTPGNERVGDDCPHPGCEESLDIGGLLEFTRTPQMPEPQGEA